MAFDNLKLEKGLYTTGKSFNDALEKIDPSENYIGTQYEGLDAYQRQLKRFDIKVSGEESDTVSKFFNTTDSSVLFPEYVRRSVKQGIQQGNDLDKIVSTTTNIDSMDYRSIELINDKEEFQLADVAEGAQIPKVTIKTKDSLTTLHKRGRMLVASYEAIKFQKLDLFTVTLKQIGNAIAAGQMNDAVMELINSSTLNQRITENPGALSYEGLVDLWESIKPYNLTSLIMCKKEVSKILKLNEFRDSAAGLNFHATGNVVTPLGADIVESSLIEGSNMIIGIDKNYALEKIQAGDVVTDFDKLIDRQLERATITSIAGFSPICNESIQAVTFAQ